MVVSPFDAMISVQCGSFLFNVVVSPVQFVSLLFNLMISLFNVVFSLVQCSCLSFSIIFGGFCTYKEILFEDF